MGARCGSSLPEAPMRTFASPAARRFFDNAAGAWMVKVFPGEYYVTGKADEVLVTILGSCVSACIRDPRKGIGGMNHFMLAEGEAGGWGGAGQRRTVRQLRDGEASQRAHQDGMLARRARDQGVRRRQRHRHAQSDRHRQFGFRDALSRKRRSQVRRAGPARAISAPHPVLPDDRPRRAPTARGRRIASRSRARRRNTRAA